MWWKIESLLMPILQQFNYRDRPLANKEKKGGAVKIFMLMDFTLK